MLRFYCGHQGKVGGPSGDLWALTTESIALRDALVQQVLSRKAAHRGVSSRDIVPSCIEVPYKRTAVHGSTAAIQPTMPYQCLRLL